MKPVILFYLFILIIPINILFAAQCDSISIDIIPDTMNYNRLEHSICINLFNDGPDTLVTVANIYVEGLSSTIVYPLGKYYSPNLLLLKPCNKTIDEGDGKYVVNFKEFPTFFIFPPKSRKEIKINTNSVFNLLAENQWKINGIMSFARLSLLDSIIIKLFPDRIESYRNDFIQSDTLNVDAQLSDSIKTTTVFKELDKPGKFNKIQDAFDIRITK